MNEASLTVHFGLPNDEHDVPATSLIALIDTYHAIFSALKIDATIRLSVPKYGGWKNTFKFSLNAMPVMAVVIPFLTGQSIDDWTLKGNKAIVKPITEFIISTADKTSEDAPKVCIDAKNKLFQQLEKDTCITFIQLGNSTRIPRNDFNKRIQKLPEDEHSFLGLMEIAILSPDWSGQRAWTGTIFENNKRKKISFDFDKSSTVNFWALIKQNGLHLKTRDVMVAQLAYNESNKPSYRVMRVIRHNDQEVDSPLSAEDFKSRITNTNRRPSASNPEQMTLF